MILFIKKISFIPSLQFTKCPSATLPKSIFRIYYNYYVFINWCDY